MSPNSIPDRLAGTVLAQYKKCGNRNCRCARGELHGPYWYRFWHVDGGKLRKQYVRLADLERVRAACAAYAEEMREGREIIAEGDRLIRWRAKRDKEPFNALREVENTLALGSTVLGLLDYASGRKGSLALRFRALDRLARIYPPTKPERRDPAVLLLGK